MFSFWDINGFHVIIGKLGIPIDPIHPVLGTNWISNALLGHVCSYDIMQETWHVKRIPFGGIHR